MVPAKFQVPFLIWSPNQLPNIVFSHDMQATLYEVILLYDRKS